MTVVYLKRTVQTKLIYGKSVGYRNRMLPATGFEQWIALLKETRLIPFSLLSDSNAESHSRPPLLSSAASLLTMPDRRRFAGQKDRMQQTTRERKKKHLGF